MLRTEIDSMPAELDELTRRVTRLEIEEAALAKETDPASKARLEELRKELADLRAEADAMRAQWEAERQALRKVQALREEIERVRHEAEEAERAYDLNRAAELRHGQLPELERRLQAEEEQLARQAGRPPAAARGGHRGRDRRDRVALDRHPGQPAPGGRAARSCCASTRSCTSGSSARTRRCSWWPTRSSGPGPGIKDPRRPDRVVHLPRARPASGRPSWPRRSPRRCSTPRTTWSAST